MANKQTFSSGWGHPTCPYWIDLIVEEKSVNTQENYSEVFFVLRARSEVTWDLEFRDRLGYIECDGSRIKSAYTNLGAWDGDGGAYNKRICSITKKIYHDSDGKKTINVNAFYDYSNILISHKWYLSAVYLGKRTFKLTDIQRKPNISASIRSQRSEEIDINWSSNILCNQVWCQYGNTIQKFNVNAKSGYVTFTNLKPNTSYTMKVWVRSSGANLWSDCKNLNAKTTDVTKLNTGADLIFGSYLVIKKTNNTGYKDDLYFFVNNKLITSKKSIPNSYTLNFTQAELDSMYKLFGTKNTATTKVRIVCNGKSQYTNEKTGVLTLTGNAKTVHIGINGSVKRGKVYIGDNKVAKKAVVWIGVGNTPRRSI